jgi:hypothetical protein
MVINNLTSHKVNELLRSAVDGYPVEGLVVEVKYCPRNSRRFASGTYYRVSNTRPDGKLIRVRVNRANKYPLNIYFKTSQYYRRKNSRGEELIYQKLVTVSVRCPEELILAIFLHEFSHYLDHLAGRNGRYKQTKADKFALNKLIEMGIINHASAPR